MNRLTVVTAVILLGAFRAPAARAQDAPRTPLLDPPAAPAWGQAHGASLGVQIVVDGVGSGNSTDPAQPRIDDMGAGLALVGGWTFAPSFHVRLTLASAQHGTSLPDLNVQHSTGTIEAHYRFLPARQVCPYVFATLGGTDVKADKGIDHLRFSGSAAGLGAGVLCGFTRHVGLDVSARYEGMNWNKAEWSEDQPGGATVKVQQSLEDSDASLRLHVGALYQF